MNSTISTPTEVGVNAHAHGDANNTQQLKSLEASPWVRHDFSRAKWYTLMYRHGAPKPVKFGRSARWIPAEVDAWVNSFINNRGAA
jgi:hypothetical protein